ncbi:MAG: sensor histidine kinase N-terminal domain-containing protein [Magnetococcales bacterium]|nr:sensor histidine kinase N-terminal domain-containing protein [Magnetococcales bacterium]
MNSLRLRLLAILLVAFTAIEGLVAALSFHQARHETDELFDAHLAQSARMLVSLLQDLNRPGDGTILPESPLGHRYQKKIAFQIWRGAVLVVRSVSAPVDRLALAEGYGNRLIDDNRWRVFLLNDGPLAIHVGESYDIREELNLEISQQMATPLLWSLPLLGIALWLGIGHGLRPMGELTRQITSRSPRDLSPILTPNAPGEMVPLMESLNNLMQRLQSALESERRFTADAAHELRTPLSGLLLHVEVGLKAGTVADKHQALQEAREGILRATHLVRQLLSLARAESGGMPDMVPIDLAAVVREQMDVNRRAAVAQGVALTFIDPPAHPVLTRGHRDSLGVALRNLVDNAIKFTQAGGRVTVGIVTADGRLALVVDDDGPGIPEGDRAVLFRRFRRGEEAGNVVGSGLGLSIVAHIAAQHGAGVELATSPLGGLRARIHGLTLIDGGGLPPPSTVTVAERLSR